MQEKLLIKSGNKTDALVWVQSFKAQSVEVLPVALKPGTEQWTPGSPSHICFSEATLCSPADALRQQALISFSRDTDTQQDAALKWRCSSGSSGRANCFLNLVIFVSGREKQLTVSQAGNKQLYISWRSCPTLFERAQILVLLHHSSTPLPATASLQPLASPLEVPEIFRVEL